MDLPKINISEKSGFEKFQVDEKDFDFNLLDFWKWNQFDLVENRTRGILAEFIVMKSLELNSKNRVEWDNYDLLSNLGKKIEVKSAFYIQTWKQNNYSKIIFNINPSKKTTIQNEYGRKSRRLSDYYVFCVLKCKDQKMINPTNIDQWDFYILKTIILDQKLPNQKTISLNSLLKLNPSKCKFNEIKNIIDK